MNNLLNQKFGSDDESCDEDYVPDAKEIAECEKELNKGKLDKKNEEKKAQKIDDLWKEMNKGTSASTNDPAPVEGPKTTDTTSDSKNENKDGKQELDIKKLLEQVNGPKEKERTLKFAGKEFVSNNGELKEVKSKISLRLRK